MTPRLPFRDFARETPAPFPGSLSYRDFDSPWGTRDQPAVGFASHHSNEFNLRRSSASRCRPEVFYSDV